MSIQVTLPNGAQRQYEVGTTIAQVAESISNSLAKSAIVGKLNGQVVDLNTPLSADAEVAILSVDDAEGLEVYRHSTAHLMAQAIKRIYGAENVRLGVGPVIEDGFFYDIDVEQPLTPEDLRKIEQTMERIASENLTISRREVSREEAKQIFGDLGDPYKMELIDAIPGDAPISIYDQGEFFDLCRGPHVPATNKLKVFKLLNVSGAYWRGDAKNKMLQRVYGTAFAKKQQLDDYLFQLEEAKKRDHRKLGKELELFMFSEEAPGMPFYLPKGMIVRNELEQYSRFLQNARDYREVRTPFIMNQRLWEQSGHWDHYQENMYFTEVDETKFALKPMNCPGHMLIFKSSLRSYRDLPIRIAEFGQVHRHEFSGALNGMMRVRTFCQDDAHIFVRPDQIQAEISRVLKLIDEIYGVFGFEYSIGLSTRPEDSMGAPELWEQAEASLHSVLTESGIPYQVNEGDGAFYGPKIDFRITDALKRSWQCATIQLDFQMPEKFDLTYIGEDGQKHRPVVIHRAVYGSIDRFIGILTEHFAGAFPLWLSPVQAVVLPIAPVHAEYAASVTNRLKEAGVRVQLDDRNEKIGYRIREAQLQKTPYMLVVGDAEVAAEAVAVRKRGATDQAQPQVAVTEIIEQLTSAIKNKSL